MPAYQIQVRGLLDGATAFVIPDPIPAPALGGVIKIDAGVAVNVGSFDLNALAGTFGCPVWVRAVNVEYAALTRAGRISWEVPGSRQELRAIPDQFEVAAAPLMAPYVLTNHLIAPKGTNLQVLTDNVNDTFGGAPVAGPHFVYLDVVPLVSDEMLSIVEKLEDAAYTKARAQGAQLSSFQAVAATLTEELAIVVPPRYNDEQRTVTGVIVPDVSARMQVQSIQITNGAIAAAGESMGIQVRRVVRTTGAVQAIATFNIDATVAANSFIEVPLTNQNNEVFTGDRIDVVRTYVAGMAPTPMTNTLVQVNLVPQQM